jgi:hypothetical protein
VRLLSPFIAGLLVSAPGWPAPGMTDDDPPPAQRADAFRRHGLDPTSPLESRVKDTPATVLEMFKEAGETAPTAHALTERNGSSSRPRARPSRPRIGGSWAKYHRLAYFAPEDLSESRSRPVAELSSLSNRPDLLASFIRRAKPRRFKTTPLWLHWTQ